MKQFCGPTFRALGYGFPYPQPDNLACYAVLGADHLRFDTDTMEMYFETRLLDSNIEGWSSEMRSVLDNYFATRPAGNDNFTRRKVEDLIRRLLPSGQCSLSLVADTLSVTERTLQARLESEDSSFRELLEKVRREVATYHLRRGDMQLTQLALVLGYSELSAFSRGFRSWYGVSPRQWVTQDAWLTGD